MQLTNEFDVSVPIDEAWRLLSDLEKVGPCLPGASITGRDGEDYLGQAKIKVGPITANYKGTARFLELDEDEYRAVLSAKGREARGGGDAQALVTATLLDKGDVTHVTVITDLNLSGKIAQFGRGVITDVSAALLKTFATRLEAMVQQDQTGDQDATATTPSATAAGGQPSGEGEPQPVTSTVPTEAPRAAPVADEDDALAILPLARSIAVSKLQQPVPLFAVVLGAGIGFLLGRRRA